MRGLGAYSLSTLECPGGGAIIEGATTDEIEDLEEIEELEGRETRGLGAGGSGDSIEGAIDGAIDGNATEFVSCE